MSAVANSETHFQQSWKDLPRTQWLLLPALWCYNSGCRQWEHIEDRLAAIKTWKVGFSAVRLAIKVCNSRGAMALFHSGDPGAITIDNSYRKKMYHSSFKFDIDWTKRANHDLISHNTQNVENVGEPEFSLHGVRKPLATLSSWMLRFGTGWSLLQFIGGKVSCEALVWERWVLALLFPPQREQDAVLPTTPAREKLLAYLAGSVCLWCRS